LDVRLAASRIEQGGRLAKDFENLRAERARREGDHQQEHAETGDFAEIESQSKYPESHRNLLCIL
jgi:hypothetical protein